MQARFLKKKKEFVTSTKKKGEFLTINRVIAFQVMIALRIFTDVKKIYGMRFSDVGLFSDSTFQAFSPNMFLL